MERKTECESGKELSSIQYFSGNPSVERTQGILHLFKDKYYFYKIFKRCLTFSNGHEKCSCIIDNEDCTTVTFVLDS